MRPFHVAACLALVAGVAGAQAPPTGADAVAREAVDTALALPPGYGRDTVLRAVSRNLRWFGKPDEGVRAARAMTDGGASEIPPGTRPGPPRFVPLAEAFPTGSPCDAGLWREEGGGTAKSPPARERWATECLLTRDFHYVGLPDVALVREAASGLPPGEVKANVLAMLIRRYGDAETLRLAAAELERDGTRVPAGARTGLKAMLAEPEALYRLGRKREAVAAAQGAKNFGEKAELIRLLLRDEDASDALAVFETLGGTPPEFADDCSSWFDSLGGLGLAYIGYARSPAAALGPFLDGLPRSPLFRRVCPTGMDAETEVAHLLAAGRLDAAVARARTDAKQPFLLVDAALEAGTARLLRGEHEAARALADEAGAALPPFDPGDPAPPVKPGDAMAGMSDAMTRISGEPSAPPRNFGERSGDTGRRFEVIRLLAAAGAADEANALARAQPAGALRAVALSAAVAGRSGIRFGDQEPSLEVISASDL